MAGGDLEHGEVVDDAGRMLARWRHDGDPAWDIGYVTVGRHADGRWTVTYTHQVWIPTRAYRTRESAWRVARVVMALRPGNWTRID